jgi:hypothetical protein
MLNVFGVLLLVSIVMWFGSGGNNSWAWWLLVSVIGLCIWPSPEDREIRRQLRKLEAIRRQRENMLNEMARRSAQPHRDSGDWL